MTAADPSASERSSGLPTSGSLDLPTPDSQASRAPMPGAPAPEPRSPAPAAPDPTADRRRRDLTRHPVAVAPTLLGAVLTSTLGGTVVAVRLTEVEAYGGVGEDPGSHAHRRRTTRTGAMFGPPGHAYVYFTYGMHWCLNVVAHDDGVAGAVLLRAGEVVTGVAAARSRRPAARRDRDLARGPARLAASLGVTGALDGADLLDPAGPLRLEPAALAAPGAGEIGVGPRTGVAGAGAATPWRFWIVGDATVSTHRPAPVRPAR